MTSRFRLQLLDRKPYDGEDEDITSRGFELEGNSLASVLSEAIDFVHEHEEETVAEIIEVVLELKERTLECWKGRNDALERLYQAAEELRTGWETHWKRCEEERDHAMKRE